MNRTEQIHQLVKICKALGTEHGHFIHVLEHLDLNESEKQYAEDYYLGGS